jgi:hypothetical protein
MRLRIGVATLVACGSFAAVAVAGGTKISNGDFEKGNLHGWTQKHTDAGKWRIVDRDGIPIETRGPTTFQPLHGDFSAITVQGFISRQFLYRTVKLDPDKRNTLKFKLAYLNQGDDFTAPNNFQLSGTNQQFRMDVMKPSSKVDSLDSDDILKNVYKTRPGDPSEQPKETISENLTPLGGGKVRLRFAVAVTESSLNVTIDDVKVKSKNK